MKKQIIILITLFSNCSAMETEIKRLTTQQKLLAGLYTTLNMNDLFADPRNHTDGAIHLGIAKFGLDNFRKHKFFVAGTSHPHDYAQWLKDNQNAFIFDPQQRTQITCYQLQTSYYSYYYIFDAIKNEWKIVEKISDMFQDIGEISYLIRETMCRESKMLSTSEICFISPDGAITGYYDQKQKQFFVLKILDYNPGNEIYVTSKFDCLHNIFWRFK